MPFNDQMLAEGKRILGSGRKKLASVFHLGVDP
jgi:hypothetical protein